LFEFCDYNKAFFKTAKYYSIFVVVGVLGRFGETQLWAIGVAPLKTWRKIFQSKARETPRHRSLLGVNEDGEG